MSDRRQADTGKTIKSVETALEILEEVKRREGATMAELAAAVDLSKSTIHHYVTTLKLYDYLEEVDGQYRAGLKPLTFGGKARAREQIYRLAKSDVDQLASETGEEARLIIEQNGASIVLYQAEGESVDRPHTYVGFMEELHCTAAGKALLAALPENRADELIADMDLSARTEHTITERDALEDELERIRSRGVAFDDEEWTEGIRCVATAITAGQDGIVGAISVSGKKERMSGDRFRTTIPNEIQNIAGVVEINTMYLEWEDDVSG